MALCSGGKDSIAATHAAMTFGPATRVVFLHTRTDPPHAHSAIDEIINWIQDWCLQNGWPFHIAHAPQSFSEIVAEHGYPGPSRHYLLYRKLKDRAIDQYNQEVTGDLYCWTGIRRFESDNRMEVAQPEGERSGARWYWRSPLVDWITEDLEGYLDWFDINTAEIVEEIGRSVDCWCGCFGDCMELIDLEAAGYSEHADWLRNLTVPEYCEREQQVWAGYNWEKHDWAVEDELQTTLCSTCNIHKTEL